jgi:hypothetical protein
LIERAYLLGEAQGLSVWTEDEAGPFQAIPQPSSSWHEEGKPARPPHEHIRGGTAKLLTLFHPATGAVRAKGVPEQCKRGAAPLAQGATPGDPLGVARA